MRRCQAVEIKILHLNKYIFSILDIHSIYVSLQFYLAYQVN